MIFNLEDGDCLNKFVSLSPEAARGSSHFLD